MIATYALPIGQQATLLHGDCLDVMRGMDAESVDAIVTDPPYGLKFMGKRWDHGVPSAEVWREAMRVLKPGGHMLAFGGTRTYHRLVCAIEDAGFEIRDMLAWVYSQGFPKSADVSKAIDKAAGVEREVVGSKIGLPGYSLADDKGRGVACVAHGNSEKECQITAPATDAARQWDGWGTALKPAHEPIVLARKPLAGTVAENVLAHGTGALNIDGCRVAHDEECRMMAPSQANIENPSEKHRQAGRRVAVLELKPEGRWPANLIHDGSDEVVSLFPRSSTTGTRTERSQEAEVSGTRWLSNNHKSREYTDIGSAARFFYCAKASKADREDGLAHREAIHRPNGNKWTDQDYHVSSGERPPSAESGPRRNHHPTVKPTELMRYLCRLITPPGGTVLDPFMGSGSTGRGAALEGFGFIGIEIDADYLAIAEARIKAAGAVV